LVVVLQQLLLLRRQPRGERLRLLQQVSEPRARTSRLERGREALGDGGEELAGDVRAGAKQPQLYHADRVLAAPQRHEDQAARRRLAQARTHARVSRRYVVDHADAWRERGLPQQAFT